MKKMAFFAALLLMIGSGACAQKSDRKAQKTDIKTEMDSLSYFFGASLGQNVKQAEIEGVNPDIVMRGFIDATEGDDSAMVISLQDGNNLIRAYMTKQQAMKAKQAIEKANQYLDSLSTDDSYTKTESGILYKVMSPGVGGKPAATDKVKVHYEGKTIDGEVFDSSYERGQPAEFGLNQVIPGWTETLQLMNVGSTVEAIIPPGLAYGERGSPPKIGPNEVLIFKIELIDIVQ